MRYVFGPYTAQNANLNGNALCAGQVSPSAALGFVGAFLRRIGYETWDYSALLIIHAMSLSAGRQRAAPSAVKGVLKPIELSETLSGEVTFSVVMDTPFSVDEDRVPGALMRMRFAGGVLNTKDGTPLHAKFRRVSMGPIANISPSLPRGFALVPACGREGADIISFGEEDTLRKVDKFLRRPREEVSGYIVPVPVGFRLLEDPASASPRQGGRNPDVPHVFSEPSVGLAEFISVRNEKIKSADEDDLKKLMWRWSTSKDSRHAMFSEFHLEASQ